MVIKRIDVVEHLSGRGIVFEKDGEELGISMHADDLAEMKANPGDLIYLADKRLMRLERK